MKLLIIRPEPGASATAARAKAAGFDPILLPFFSVQPCAWDVPGPAQFDAMLITSANAIRHGGPGLKSLQSLPTHVVGERSADAAIAAGFALASTGIGGIASSLAQLKTPQHLLWLAGADRQDPQLPDGIMLSIREVYESVALPQPDDVAAVIASADIVALHSVRAAMRFGDVVDRVGLDRGAILLAAFSPAIAASAGEGWAGFAIAASPNDGAMLSAASELGKRVGIATARKVSA